jgi:hypothetical protein
VLLLTEHHAMKAYWGIGGMAPLVLVIRADRDTETTSLYGFLACSLCEKGIKFYIY